MRGSIRHRSEERAGSWEYIVDLGLAAAQRCTVCQKRFWIERRPRERCSKCGAPLQVTPERRRETKGGFRTRKECQAALTKALIAVETHTPLCSPPTSAWVTFSPANGSRQSRAPCVRRPLRATAPSVRAISSPARGRYRCRSSCRDRSTLSMPLSSPRVACRVRAVFHHHPFVVSMLSCIVPCVTTCAGSETIVFLPSGDCSPRPACAVAELWACAGRMLTLPPARLPAIPRR